MNAPARWALTLLLGALALGAGVPAAAVDFTPPPQRAVSAPPPGWPSAPAVQAASYLLLDADTGQVIAERDADRRRPVASTVKVLTALSVLDRTDPDDVVTVGQEVVGIGGAGVGLDPGEQWTVAQLLEGLIARSGNDAAMAVAAHVGGSVDGFVELMRSDATQLGLHGLTLATPSGLEDSNRLSARDLAVITRVALQDPTFRAVSARPAVSLPGIGTIESRNELLGVYDGAIGVKTGYTDEAGYCVVAAAERDGRELIAVVLDSPTPSSRFTDAGILLDHGFGRFATVDVGVDVRLRQAGSWVRLRTDQIALLVPRRSPKLEADSPLSIEIPTRESVGEVDVRWRGEQLSRLPLRAEPSGRPPTTGGGAVGQWLTDRAYAAMRAATLAGAWPT